MPADEQDGASSTLEEINAASDAALAAGDVARYTELENARETGTPLKVETPAASKEETEKPADSETATPDKSIQEKRPRKGGEERKVELGAEIQALLKTRAELEADIEVKRGEKKAAPPPAAETKVVEKPAAPVKPKLENFKTFAEFDAANDAYVLELVQFNVKETVSAARAEEQQSAVEKTLREAWDVQVAEAREEHADYVEVAFSKTTPITRTMDGFILKAGNNGARILYKLGENDSAEGKRIAALDPYDQVEALGEIKRSLTTPEKKTAPVKKHTAAPPPATNLGSRETEHADPEQAALNRGDYATYTKLANARELKAARG